MLGVRPVGFVAAFLLCALALGFFAAAPPSTEGRHALSSELVFKSGPHLCDGSERQATWENTTAGPLRVVRVEAWLGANLGAVVDQWVFVGSDTKVLGHTNWDRYANPTAPHNVVWEWSPDYIPLLPGEKVGVRYGCKDLQGKVSLGDVVLTAWWW